MNSKPFPLKEFLFAEVKGSPPSSKMKRMHNRQKKSSKNSKQT